MLTSALEFWQPAKPSSQWEAAASLTSHSFREMTLTFLRLSHYAWALPWARRKWLTSSVVWSALRKQINLLRTASCLPIRSPSGPVSKIKLQLCFCVASLSQVHFRHYILDTQDYCMGDPCLNGGTCFELATDYTCMCVDMFTGQNCDDGSKIFSFSPVQHWFNFKSFKIN